MPGVLGVVDPESPDILDAALQQLEEPLKHRASYATRAFIGRGVAMATLSLRAPDERADLACSSDGRYVLTFEGRLDNRAELLAALELPAERARAMTSAEAALEGYLRWGTGLFERLNGCFQLAIWDSVAAELIVATDPGGLRPLYYAHRNGRFVWAPEVKALLAVPWVSRTPDYAGINSFLQHGFPLGVHTFFKDVTLLPGASFARVRQGRLEVRSYWRMRLGSTDGLPEREAIESFTELWKNVMRDHVDEGARLGTLLSGGLDSRLILSGLQAVGSETTAFTFGERGCADERIAQQVALVSGCPHRVRAVDPSIFVADIEDVVRLTDGMFNYAHSGVRHIVPALEAEVDVAFDGITLLDSFFYAVEIPLRRFLPGANDELSWLRLALMKDDARALDLGNGAPVNLLNAGSELQVPFPTDDYLADYAHSARAICADAASLSGLFDMELRQSRFTSFGPALMRSAVDVRCPFFDKRVMQFGAGMSPRFRSKDKLLQAGALARLAPQLASIPWLRTGLPANAAPVVYYGALGARFVTSRARRWAKTRLGLSLPGGSSDALIDHGRILREQPEVRRRVETLLAKPSPTCSGFFDAENVRRLLAHHCAGNTDHTEVIGRLLTVEVWHRMFQAA